MTSEFSKSVKKLSETEKELRQTVVDLNAVETLDLETYSDEELQYLIFSLKAYIKEASDVFQKYRSMSRKPIWIHQERTRQHLYRSYRYISLSKSLLLRRSLEVERTTEVDRKIKETQDPEIKKWLKKVEESRRAVLASVQTLSDLFIYVDESSYISNFIVWFSNAKTKALIEAELKILLTAIDQLDVAEQGLLGPVKLYILSSQPEHHVSYTQLVDQMRAQEFRQWAKVAREYLRRLNSEKK